MGLTLNFITSIPGPSIFTFYIHDCCDEEQDD